MVRPSFRWLTTLVVAALLAAACLQEVVEPSPAPPTPAPSSSAGGPSGPLEAGMVRVRDDLGGWALDIPADWWAEPSFQHGYDLRSYDPTVAAAQGARLAAPGGVLVTLRMRQNPKLRDPRHYYVPEEGPDLKVLDRGTDKLAGQYAVTWLVWHKQVQPYEWMEPTLRWFVMSPFFPDRMVVITVSPGNSAVRQEVDRIVHTLQFYPPTPPPRDPLVGRDQILRAVLQEQKDAGATVTRSVVKLVRYKRVEAGLNAGQDHLLDPDMLVWAVVLEGSNITCSARGRPECSFLLAVEAARPPEHVSRRFALPEWPGWFDRLIDLERS